MTTLPSKLFLIGYRAVGKTTVGQILAEKLGATFLDTDALILEEINKPISEFFKLEGEAAFRDVETQVLQAVCSREDSPLVISTGGGIIVREENIDLLRENGTVIWLRASVETIQKRLHLDPETQANRPGLTGGSAVDEVSQVLTSRLSLYERCAHTTIDTDPPKDISMVVAEILGQFKY